MIKNFKFLSIMLGVGLLLLFLSTITIANNSPAEQQDIKASLFKEAVKAMKDAKEANADILSPKNFSDGLKYYQDADNDFQKGRNLEDIRKKLRASAVYFNKAIEETKLAEVTLAHSIKARSDANQAGAPQYSSKTWGIFFSLENSRSELSVDPRKKGRYTRVCETVDDAGDAGRSMRLR